MSPEQPTTLGDFTKLLDSLREQAALQGTMMSINQALLDVIQHLESSTKTQAAAIRDALQGLEIPAPQIVLPPPGDRKDFAGWHVQHKTDSSGVITDSYIRPIKA